MEVDEDNPYGDHIEQAIGGITVHEASKVRFRQDVATTPAGINCVVKDGKCDVHVGLLSVDHTYHIEFDMPHRFRHDLEVPPLQVPDMTVYSMVPLANHSGHHLTIELKCHEEGKLKRSITFESSDGQVLLLTVFAKVMGRSRGTPALKSGVRVVHVHADAMSDATEWQGFS